ncbi:MAG: iron-containing alcohol dehydrogenase [Bryobacteraceae bacterium]|nr:iron-containing alcohol dehydrogenase [Bryobacterales bacterium]MEB2360370.1 iron-containing alcohol dehydrogenase [Bryobacterales bacterium]NUN01626.1 iron-containing alcohol dehydrogenase [Bryobacteraceae bacterium]
MSFEFATASRIVFGRGAVREIVPSARRMGARALVVTGRHPERAGWLMTSLTAAGLDPAVFPVDGEPTIDSVRNGVELARKRACDVIISLGGGSAIDAGKGIAALLANNGDPLDYLEVVGKGRALEKPSAPFIAAPATAGTGSEVTRNAVLASPADKVKASLRSPFMLPELAVVDPELTLDLPPDITAFTGLDALTQVIEPYVSARRNAMTDLFCLEGMRRVSRSLVQAYDDGASIEAREDMAFASLMGGLSLANAGLGVVHGFAAPIGGMFNAPHGAVCAALLPHGIKANIRALTARAGDHEVLDRYQMVARILTGDEGASAEDGAAWVHELCRRLGIPGLAAYGVDAAAVPVLVEKASGASSMKANPLVLTREELTDTLERAL